MSEECRYRGLYFYVRGLPVLSRGGERVALPCDWEFVGLPPTLPELRLIPPALPGPVFMTSCILRPADEGATGGGECEREFDLPLRPPNPASTCIGESVVGEGAPPVLDGEWGSERVAIGGRAIELPDEGPEDLIVAGPLEEDTIALGGGGKGSRSGRPVALMEDGGLRSCILTSLA